MNGIWHKGTKVGALVIAGAALGLSVVAWRAGPTGHTSSRGPVLGPAPASDHSVPNWEGSHDEEFGDPGPLIPDLGASVGEEVLAASAPLLIDDYAAVAHLMKSRNVVGDAVPAADEYNVVSTGLHSLEFSEAALACGIEDRHAGPVWLEFELGPVGDHLEVLSAHAADPPTERAAAVATTDPEIVECVARAVVGLPVRGVEGLSFSIVFSVHPRRALDAERGIAKALPPTGEVPLLFDPSAG